MAANASADETKPTWSIQSDGFAFEWDIAQDSANIRKIGAETPSWRGSLLPALIVLEPNGRKTYVKARPSPSVESIGADGGNVALTFGELGRGNLALRATEYGLEFSNLTLDWTGDARPIFSLYFGTSLLSGEERQSVPSLDEPFWPDWQSESWAIPGAKGAPIQSIFRSWDLGHANLPLGSFGPGLGTPYCAAYPRPLYAASMGNADGWICIGPGSVPDGALSLKIQSSSSCLHHLYREDLWGGPKQQRRFWDKPLRLAWAPTPWHAFQKLFSSFDTSQILRSAALENHWNSWGDFKKQIYQIRQLGDWVKAIGVKSLIIDDRWESFVGSGKPNFTRFPHFDEDISYLKKIGLTVGFWQPLGWVDKPEEVGLTNDDLVLSPDGRPSRMSWDVNPHNPHHHFCLDPSSSKAVQFLRERTVTLMKKYQPALLKFDFGYGLPNPNVGAPRDPSLRGERYCLTLLKIVADAARSISHDVSIEYYSIHPLVRSIANVVSMDDLGDAGLQEAAGHRQWSVWSALAGHRTAIMASSGYLWENDAEVVLDTVVVGVPGAVLSRTMDDASPVPQRFLSRRAAINRWHRKTTDWKPLWLNSEPGHVLRDPQLCSMGRLEQVAGQVRLTALTLRDEKKERIPRDTLKGVRWSGNWGLISQDDQDIFSSRQLACIPIDAAYLELPRQKRPSQVLSVTSLSTHDWSNWSWSKGSLTLRAEDITDDILGFLILEQ